MDQQKLRNLVFEKTGVKVDSDDPIFALVALNEAVLAETVQQHVALIEAATRELVGAARGQAGLLSGAAAGVPAGVAAAPAGATAPPSSAPGSAMALAPRELGLLGAAAGVAVLSALLVLAGQRLLSQPAPVPLAAPVASAPALTGAQRGALAEAKKLAAAVARLDPKSRSLVQAEMNKP